MLSALFACRLLLWYLSFEIVVVKSVKELTVDIKYVSKNVHVLFCWGILKKLRGGMNYG